MDPKKNNCGASDLSSDQVHSQASMPKSVHDTATQQSGDIDDSLAFARASHMVSPQCDDSGYSFADMGPIFSELMKQFTKQHALIGEASAHWPLVAPSPRARFQSSEVMRTSQVPSSRFISATHQPTLVQNMKNDAVQPQPRVAHEASSADVSTQQSLHAGSNHSAPDSLPSKRSSASTSVGSDHPPFDDDIAVLIEMCRTSVGLALLHDSPELIKRLSPQILNDAVAKGPLKDVSVLYGLISHGFGASILSRWPNLIGHISPNGLNTVISGNFNDGLSPLFWFCHPSNCHFLSNYSDLVMKIQPAAWNTPAKCDRFKGVSPFSWIVASELGRSLLFETPALIDMTSAETLNRPIEYREGAFITPAEQLFTTDDGLRLLHCNPRLANMISADVINSTPQGYYREPSLFAYLCSREIGPYILLECPDLLSRVSETALNQTYSDGERSALACLASTEIGRDVLLRHPCLVNKITPQGLNHPLWDGKAKDGMSAIFHLAITKQGLDIIAKNPDILEKIDDNGTSCSSEQGDDEDSVDFSCQSLESILRNPEYIGRFCCHPGGRLLLRHVAGIGPSQDIPVVSSDDTGQASTCDEHSDFLCPLSHKVVRQPVQIQHDMVASTNTYEYHAIFWWLCEHRTCPLTGIAILDPGVTPDTILQHDSGYQVRLQSKILTGLAPNYGTMQASSDDLSTHGATQQRFFSWGNQENHSDFADSDLSDSSNAEDQDEINGMMPPKLNGL